MGFIEHDAETVVQAISDWNPGISFSEATCHRALAQHLRIKFPRKAVLVEHPIGRGRADIFIDFKDWTGFGAKVVVELKYDLQTLNEYHRLVGQLGDYVGIADADVLVVLCGKTKAELASLVLQRVRDLTATKIFRKGAVIVKPFTARGTSGRFISVRT